MKSSPFDSFGFRQHLEATLSQAVKTYFAKELEEAAQRKENILKDRTSYWGNESRGWVEEYSLIVEHFRSYGGKHSVRVGVRDTDRTFTIHQYQHRPGEWYVLMDDGHGDRDIGMEGTDLNSLIQQVVVMSIGHAYFEPELLSTPDKSSIKKKPTKRKG